MRGCYGRLAMSQPTPPQQLPPSPAQAQPQKPKSTMTTSPLARARAASSGAPPRAAAAPPSAHSQYYLIRSATARVVARGRRRVAGRAGSGRCGAAAGAEGGGAPRTASRECSSGEKSAQRRARNPWATMQRVAWWWTPRQVRPSSSGPSRPWATRSAATPPRSEPLHARAARPCAHVQRRSARTARHGYPLAR